MNIRLAAICCLALAGIISCVVQQHTRAVVSGTESSAATSSQIRGLTGTSASSTATRSSGIGTVGAVSQGRMPADTATDTAKCSTTSATCQVCGIWRGQQNTLLYMGCNFVSNRLTPIQRWSPLDDFAYLYQSEQWNSGNFQVDGDRVVLNYITAWNGIVAAIRRCGVIRNGKLSLCDPIQGFGDDVCLAAQDERRKKACESSEEFSRGP